MNNDLKLCMKYKLKLYVAGDNSVSSIAIATITELRETLSADIDLEIVDILAHPEISRQERVIATPLLVRQSPGPVRKMIGDLTDHTRVVQALQLDDPPESTEFRTG